MTPGLPGEGKASASVVVRPTAVKQSRLSGTRIRQIVAKPALGSPGSARATGLERGATNGDVRTVEFAAERSQELVSQFKVRGRRKSRDIWHRATSRT